MRFASKRQLAEMIQKEHETFVDLTSSIPRTRHREEGVWGEGWTIQDLYAHLTEWEQMFLGWYREGLDGGNPPLPAPGYNVKRRRIARHGAPGHPSGEPESQPQC